MNDIDEEEVLDIVLIIFEFTYKCLIVMVCLCLMWFIKTWYINGKIWVVRKDMRETFNHDKGK